VGGLSTIKQEGGAKFSSAIEKEAENAQTRVLEVDNRNVSLLQITREGRGGSELRTRREEKLSKRRERRLCGGGGRECGLGLVRRHVHWSKSLGRKLPGWSLTHSSPGKGEEGASSKGRCTMPVNWGSWNGGRKRGKRSQQKKLIRKKEGIRTSLEWGGAKWESTPSVKSRKRMWRNGGSSCKLENRADFIKKKEEERNAMNHVSEPESKGGENFSKDGDP